MAETEPKGAQNRRLYVFIFRGPLFFGLGAVVKRSKIAPGALREGHEASKRALGPLSEASGPHFGASEAGFDRFQYTFRNLKSTAVEPATTR